MRNTNWPFISGLVNKSINLPILSMHHVSIFLNDRLYLIRMESCTYMLQYIHICFKESETYDIRYISFFFDQAWAIRQKLFSMFMAFAQILNSPHVRFSEIIQFRTVIIPTQIVFMWSLKSSKLLWFCPKMNVYISCLIGNTLRLKMYFLNFAEAVIYYLL